MTLAAGVLAALCAVHQRGFWGYLLVGGGALDGRSVLLWLGWGLWPLFLAAGLWAAALGLGHRAHRSLGVEPEGGLERIAAAALGLALIGQAVFLLGVAGLLRPVPLSLLAASAAALGWSALPRVGKHSKTQGLTPLTGAAAGLLGYGAVHWLVTALAPPTDWDARAYHLAVPELCLAAGRALELPWLLHAHWPQLMEWVNVLPLAAGRDGAAALVHAGAAAALVAGAAAAARAHGRPAAWTAALVLAGQPALLATAPVAHSDGAAALLFLAAAAALARWDADRTDGRLVLAGLLAGFSASAKVFGGAGALCWALWLVSRTRRPREALVFAGAAAAAVGPWLLRGWLVHGDPVWPFLSGALGLDASAAGLLARYRRSAVWDWPPPAWAALRYGPGFLLAPLAGLALLGRGAPRANLHERLLWLPAPLLVLLTLRHHEAWRFLLPCYAAAALACARFASAALARPGARRFAAAALVALAAAPLAGLEHNNELFAVIGPRSRSRPQDSPRDIFEERAVAPMAFYKSARAALPRGARILLFREIRGYRAGFDYQWGDPINQAEADYARLPGPEALAARLKELGVTHVLDHPGSSVYREDPWYYDGRTLALMRACLERRGRLVLSADGFSLWELL